MDKKKNKIYLSIKDNGSGLPEDFDIENTGGFGLRLVKMLIQQLDGTFTIAQNNGTESIVTFEE
jgi:two-component sensor histidine kinase